MLVNLVTYLIELDNTGCLTSSLFSLFSRNNFGSSFMREVALDFNKEIHLLAMVLPGTKWAKRTCGGLKSLLCVAAFSAEQSGTNLKISYLKKCRSRRTHAEV